MLSLAKECNLYGYILVIILDDDVVVVVAIATTANSIALPVFTIGTIWQTIICSIIREHKIE